MLNKNLNIIIDEDNNKIFAAEEHYITGLLTKNKISVVIPTMQKNKMFLDNLVKTLNVDVTVDEIIVIDNSCKGYSFDSDKLKVIVPEENLYVNPSWNLGVKTAKNEIVALLNDDITIPENFCEKVYSLFNETTGIIGMSKDFVEDKPFSPDDNIKLSDDLYLKEITYLPWNFGIMMFFRKDAFVEIPKDLKVYYGDNWMIFWAKKMGKINYTICGQKIYHYGSLTSNKFKDYAMEEGRIFRRLTLTPLQKIFSFETTNSHKIIRIFGITFSFKYN